MKDTYIPKVETLQTWMWYVVLWYVYAMPFPNLESVASNVTIFGSLSN